MPERVCIGDPTCGEPAVYRGRCSRHRNETSEIIRSKEQPRIYDTRRWQRLRRKKLSANPICEYCGDALARDVDHVVPIANGGDPWAMSNLRSACTPCHSRKTRSEQLAGAS